MLLDIFAFLKCKTTRRECQYVRELWMEADNVADGLGPIAFWGEKTYGMRSIVDSPKMDHTVQTSVRCPSTLSSMRVQLFLGQNVTTTLCHDGHVSLEPRTAVVPNRGVLEVSIGKGQESTSQEKDTMAMSDSGLA